jgi:hypothetical protein
MTDGKREYGIPTRAIHESYLTMQKAHSAFRKVKTEGDSEGALKAAQADFQEAVLQFFELIRPHLKRNGAMTTFWYGELPDYPNRPWASVEAAQQYCQRQGTAVWQLQQHTQTSSRSPNVGGEEIAATDGGTDTLAGWHDRLNLSEYQRVVSVGREDGELYWVELRAVCGLQHLDSWDVRKQTTRERGDGFMSSKTATTTELEYVAPWKLVTAKRVLGEAADKMNLLSQIDIDHDDGAIVNFDQSRDDVQASYTDAEYDSSPDI